MKRGGPIPRTARLRARSRTRGGRNSLPGKLAWLREQRCDICGRLYPEVHHDRRLGSRADDRRTVPLCQPFGKAGHHRDGPESVQVLGRTRFQELHRYDLDARCAYWQARWDAQERAA